METTQANFIQQLEEIEMLLKQAISSPDYTALLQSGDYPTDDILGDALIAVQQTISSHQGQKRRLPYTNTWV